MTEIARGVGQPYPPPGKPASNPLSISDDKYSKLFVENIPIELKNLRHWVCWKFVWNEEKQKYDKVPIDAKTGYGASSTNPNSWSSFDKALDSYSKWFGKPQTHKRKDDKTGKLIDVTGLIEAIGFMFEGTDYVGIDLDNCMDASGNLKSEAFDIVNTLNSYTEYSQSGKGLHIICKGKLPAGGRRKDGGQKDGIEMYGNGSPRGFLMTGNTLAKISIRECQPEINAVHAQYIGGLGNSEAKTPPPPVKSALSDDAILEKALAAPNNEMTRKLYYEGWTKEKKLGFDTHSQADQSLCNRLAGAGADKEQIDRLFRKSALMTPKWNRISYRNPTIDKAIADNAPAFVSGATLDWNEAIPLITTAESLPYPVTALPLILRDAVADVAAATRAPLPLIASSALAAAAISVQGIFDVRRRKSPELSGPTSLLFLTVAQSGERKTAVDKFFMRGIREYESTTRREKKTEIDDYAAEQSAWIAKKKGLEAEIQRLARKGKDTSSLLQRLKDNEVLKPKPPKIPRLAYADATPEALAAGLSNWSSAGVFSSEGGAIFGSHGMGKDSSMRNVSLYNQLWDGVPITFDRRTSESIALNNARLTISIMVQAEVFQNYIEQHGNGELLRGSGFLARFLICQPQSTMGTRVINKHDPPIDLSGLNAFNNRALELLKLTKTDDDGVVAEMLGLNPAAYEVWRIFHNDVEKELAPDGEFCDVADVAAKVADNAARLAGIFHVFENKTGEVSEINMKNGADLALWYLHEARRFFGAIALPPKIADAAKLEKWLIEHCRKNGGEPISTGSIAHDGPNSLRKKETFEAAIQVLCEHSRAQIKKQGNKTLVWILNSPQKLA